MAAGARVGRHAPTGGGESVPSDIIYSNNLMRTCTERDSPLLHENLPLEYSPRKFHLTFCYWCNKLFGENLLRQTDR